MNRQHMKRIFVLALLLTNIIACSKGAPLKTSTPLQSPAAISDSLACSLSGLNSFEQVQVDSAGTIVGNNQFTVAVNAHTQAVSAVPVILTSLTSDPVGAFTPKSSAPFSYTAAPSVSIQVLNANQIVRFTARVQNQSGAQATCSLDVTFSPVVSTTPSVKLFANDTEVSKSIEYNGRATLRWEAQKMASCALTNVATGAALGSDPVAGSVPVGPLTATQNYRISCVPIVGFDQTPVTKSVQVVVSAAPTASILANGNTSTSTTAPVIVTASTFSLSWSAAGVSTCEISGGEYFAEVVNLVGSFTAVPKPQVQTVYAIDCKNSDGLIVKTATVTVAARSSNIVVDFYNYTRLTTVDYDTAVRFVWAPYEVASNGTRTLRSDIPCSVYDSFSKKTYSGAAGSYRSDTEPLKQGTHQFTVSCIKGDLSATNTLSIVVSEPKDNVIFATSQGFKGALGGVGGADQKCKTAATAGGIRADRNWKAVLGKRAITFLANNIVKQRTVSNGVATYSTVSTKDAFWTASWTAGVSSNEYGAAISTNDPVWTGLTALNILNSGTFDESSSNCGLWTSEDIGQVGAYGQTALNSKERFAKAYDRCNLSHKLYCISE